MKLMLLSNDGEVLDTVEFTRDEWDNLSPAGAKDLLDGLSPGAGAR